MRLAVARRGRALGVVGVLGASVAVVLLMLALADRLVALRDDPTTLGKAYSLVVTGAGPAAVDAVPGVAGAANRFSIEAVDAFELGEPVRAVAVDAPVPSRFEGPPLADGRRARGDREAEVGVALAQVLGLRPGGELALLLPNGSELRLRVAGIVRALDNDGRMAYVPAAALTAAAPQLAPEVAVQLERGADRAAVTTALRAIGAEPKAAAGAAPRDRRFLGLLAALLRVVAGVTAAVCLFALVQSLSVVALERRATLAVLRSFGAGTGTLVAVLAGASLALAAAAVVAGALLQRALLGPLVARLAAGYADLPLGASAPQVAGVAAGVLALAALAAVLVARRVASAPVVAALREP